MELTELDNAFYQHTLCISEYKEDYNSNKLKFIFMTNATKILEQLIDEYKNTGFESLHCAARYDPNYDNCDEEYTNTMSDLYYHMSKTFKECLEKNVEIEEFNIRVSEVYDMYSI